MSIRAFYAFVAIAGLLLAATGCGGNSDASSGEITVETGSLSKAQFIKKADAICEESIEKVRVAGASYLRSVESSETPYAAQKTEAPRFIETVIMPEYEDQIDEISSLGAPRGDAKEVAAVLGAMKEDLDKAEVEPVTFLQTVNPFPNGSRLGKKYGFAYCGGID